ncbi:MAG: sigma-70 family RNA polymerase sigma factor [Acidobacteria bacterium]|nr:sigma-70 family RNA polymerase sigma factor [Acidobacteriota bacterium]
MTAPPQPEPSVTELLVAWRAGDPDALDRLTPRIYRELRRLAQHHVGYERRGQTLAATDLVHEAFLRLVDVEVPWQDRAHFLAVAARLMRRILINRSRDKARLKRGGGNARVSLEELGGAGPEPATPPPALEILELDRALTELAELDPDKARVVELVYFGGLTYEEVAETLGVSRATAHRHLRLAKAWLHDRLGGAGTP